MFRRMHGPFTIGIEAMNKSLKTQTHRIADALHAVRHVFVRDLEIVATLGIHDHEKLAPQRIIVNIDLSVSDAGAGHDDSIANVVSYEDVVAKVQAIADAGHVNLVETMAEKIAQRCLEDRRVQVARVRIEKPEIVANAASVGIEIERIQPLG